MYNGKWADTMAVHELLKYHYIEVKLFVINRQTVYQY